MVYMKRYKERKFALLWDYWWHIFKCFCSFVNFATFGSVGTTLLGRVLLSAALCPSVFRLFHFFSSSDPREKITFVVRVFSWGWGEGGDCHFGRGLWDFLQSCGPILHLRCLGCYFWISASVSRASNLHKVVPEVLCFKVTWPMTSSLGSVSKYLRK